jgi:glutamine synthetase
MECVQPEENHTAAVSGAVPRTDPSSVARRLPLGGRADDGGVQAEENHATTTSLARAPSSMARGYLFMAASVMAACAGILDGLWASGFGYTTLC